MSPLREIEKSFFCLGVINVFAKLFIIYEKKIVVITDNYDNKFFLYRYNIKKHIIVIGLAPDNNKT